MPCLWYKLCSDGKSYDYLTHHVDDFLLTSNDPSAFMDHLRKEYTVTGRNFSDVHLGMNLKPCDDPSTLYLSCQGYIKEAITCVCSLLNLDSLKTYDSIAKDTWHPQLDDSPKLDTAGIKLYQHLIGIGIWLICIGRFNIHFPINQLSRFTSSPTRAHLNDLIHVFGFVTKWAEKGSKTEGKPTVSFWNDLDSRPIEFLSSMKDYYQDSFFESLKDPLYLAQLL